MPVDASRSRPSSVHHAAAWPEYRTATRPGRAQARRARAVALAVACLLAASPAAAAGGDWYASMSGTVSWLQDVHSEVEGLPDPPVAGGRAEHDHFMDTGYGMQAALGYRLGRFRLEAELGQARNDGEGYELKVPVRKTGKWSDEYHESQRLMLNAYVDFGEGRLRPYVGAGVGRARVHIRFFGQHPILDALSPREFLDGTDYGTAWQVVGGTAWQLSPRVALTAQYRWFDAGTLELPDRSGFFHERDHAGGNVDLGVRFEF